MAGVVGVDDKANMPAQGNGKKGKTRGRSSGSGARRLSISGSKLRLRYVRVTNRFQRKGGLGRGRITAHLPLHFDGSITVSDSEGDKRKSFVVFEDDVDSASSKSKQVESAAELETRGKVSPVADSKNAAVENCRTPETQGTVEQIIASRAPVQQGSKYHVMENFVAFRARNKSMLSAKLRPLPVASLVGPTNQQESSSRSSLEILAAKWQRGGRRSLFTQRSLDTNELEDREQIFRNMDEEDPEKEMDENNLEMEMRKYDLENVIQPRSQLEYGELFVSVKASDVHETVLVPVEEQANVGELAPEPFNSQKWELLSPGTGGLGTEDEDANVDLATPLPNDPKEKRGQTRRHPSHRPRLSSCSLEFRLKQVKLIELSSSRLPQQANNRLLQQVSHLQVVTIKS